MKLKLLGLNCIFLVTACGGGSGGSSGGGSGTPSDSLKGIFTDSPVYGVKYQTDSLQGLTNALGEFDYREGESIVFSIGDLQFPSISASQQITPTDLAQGSSEVRTNILQLLQSLDDDNNPDNGISISAEAENAFKDSTLDLESADFDSEAQAILDTIGDGIQLVSEEQAEAHFQSAQEAQILGSWLYSEGNGKRNVLTFVEGNEYVIIHEHTDDGDQVAGSVEYGTYSWDIESGAFSTSLIEQSDNSGGLYDEGSSVSSASLVGDELTLGFTDDAGETVTFSRIKNLPGALQGAWKLYEAESDNLNILTFLSDTEYVLAHTNNLEDYDNANEPAQALSGEFGTLAISGDNYTATASIETDGDGGLYNKDHLDENTNTFTVERWGDLSSEDIGEGDEYSFTRIGQFTTTLVGDGENLDDILAHRETRFDEAGLVGDWQVTTTSPSYHDKVGFVESFSVQLKADGTGTVTFEENDVTTLVWELNSAGTLTYTETDEFDDTWFLNIAPVKGAANSVLIDSKSPAGQEDFADVLVEARFTRIADEGPISEEIAVQK
ncbi:hypothetical protein [Zhongshania aliphaticivorans]|uniref:hypothetical protein n=1 Tax=Zhongshania aliphaticivorans TaxID=1470434 RepID=UPI0012E636A1|nr:hypothetical protein [Zhongshania aliphaticivorans]CAA0117970.1 Uncharacterised protein [Zhongshania aliphaticivorans]